MERHVKILEELRAVPRDQFLKDPRIHLLAERCFQLSIQCVIDVCHYITALHGWEKADESRDAILRLGQEGLLPTELTGRIAGMAGFRNILVHAYLRINREIVHDYLSRLGDFCDFAAHIEKTLSAPPA